MIISCVNLTAFAEETTTSVTTADALATALSAGGEVKLGGDITNLEVTISQDTTLDLGGYTITDAYIIVTADVEIKNGKIVNTNEPYPLVIQNGGVLDVTNVDIEASKSDRAIWVRSSNSILNLNEGTDILATKGENNTKTSMIAGIYTDTNTTVNLNGATITVDTPNNQAVGIYGNYTNANVNMTSGKISTNGKNYSCGIKVDGDITVSGGAIVTNEKGYTTGNTKGITNGYNYAISTALGNVTITGGSITTNGYSGYMIEAGRSYSAVPQTISISNVTFTNVLTETDISTGGHTAPVLIKEGSASTVTATITSGTFNGISSTLVKGDSTSLEVSGGTFENGVAEKYLAEGYEIDDNGVVKKDLPTVAYIGETGYETVQAAIDAAKENDTVTISAGEFNPINISNKKITLEGTVGDNGELLTTIKGGNPAITGHSFNGTIKDIKIVDAWKVMYAEPAGDINVDNVYVTGATYGFHLVAYSPDLTWEIENSYMDLRWANSFGVYENGYADIIIRGNEFVSTDPYYSDYGAIHVNSFLPSVTVEENIFGKNAKIYIDANTVTDTSKINISKNYHADGVENAFADDADGVTVPIDSYYKTYTVNEDGTFALSDLMVNKLPNAEVKNLGIITVKNNEGDYKFDGSYYVYDLIGGSGLSESSKPFDMQVAMEFIAKDTAEEAAKNTYGDYTTDFFIKITGLEDGSFVGNECYLAGYYPAFGNWVKIPLDGFTIEDGVVYPVITSAGFDFKYTDICSSVQDFICGIYLSDDVIENNPNIKVQLDLGLSETYEAAQNAEFVTVDSYVYDAEDLKEVDHGIFGIGFYVVDMDPVYEDTYRIGLFAGIDSLKYKEVGFKIYDSGKHLASGSTTDVYKKITASNMTLAAEEFDLFRFFGIPVDFPTSYDNVEGLQFQPYAIDLFGNTIDGRMYDIYDIYTLDEKEVN